VELGTAYNRAVYTDMELIQTLLCLYYVVGDYILVFQWFLYERPHMITRLLWVTVLVFFASSVIPIRDPEARSTFGVVCGWIAAVLYIVSRFPQIFANCSGNVEEVSFLTFLTTTAANVAYGLFILLGPDDPELLPW
jgi:hypothetical protein